VIAGDAGAGFTDPDALEHGLRFYRIRQKP